MEVIDVDNVHQALPEGCLLITTSGKMTGTRNGVALILPEPLCTIYRKPNQRVLFWEERDANPFFHLMEALWMMAGRRDVAWVGRFNSNIQNYSDDGVVFNAAYGHRWRHFFGTDQIRVIIHNLRLKPECRRQVLTMWSVRDLLFQDTKDVPCNTSAYFQIRDGKLDMMVNNRSNDLIWGTYGANAVHFSFLQEVVASFVGVGLGSYHQVSMNTHVYDAMIAKAKVLAEWAPDLLEGERHADKDPYAKDYVSPYPIVGNANWFRDLDLFLEGATRGYTNQFFPEVALPLLESFFNYKSKKLDVAMRFAESCAATDWGRAAVEWLLRRKK